MDEFITAKGCQLLPLRGFSRPFHLEGVIEVVAKVMKYARVWQEIFSWINCVRRSLACAGFELNGRSTECIHGIRHVFWPSDWFAGDVNGSKIGTDDLLPKSLPSYPGSRIPTHTLLWKKLIEYTRGT
jgi:hypothetical protein